MLKNFNIAKTYQALLIILAFLMPLTVFGANLIIVIICLIWLFSGDYKNKYFQIISNKFIVACLIFFFLHVLGLLWTEDLAWGFHIVHKMWYFLLLLPVLFTIVKKENIKLYVSAFLLAISLTEIASYLVWFELVEPFKNATVNNPTPFMSHISYNPILAFAIYLVAHEIFFNKKLSNLAYSYFCFFAISMTINMFITGGRAGQVTFFVMLSVLIFQVLNKQRAKSLLVICILIPAIFTSAYYSSNLFNKRVNMAIDEFISFSETQGIDKITQGHSDVIIADGFSGNISLKTAEGTARLVTFYLKQALTSSLSSKIGYFFAKKAINDFRLHMDPRKYNGAVFLGLNGVAVKSHGGTDSYGFANAISVAVDMVQYNFISDLRNVISKSILNF